MKLNKAAILTFPSRGKATKLGFVEQSLSCSGWGRKIKHAAMFGLDARIALAIFGALSVISGAALYNAIQNSKAMAILYDMTEIGKAWEQHYLDTGIELPSLGESSYTTKLYIINLQDLVSDNKSDSAWQGPYLSYSESSDSTVCLDNPNYGIICTYLLTNEKVWGDTTTWQDNGTCTSGYKCYISVQFTGMPNESLAEIIDEKIDNGNGDSDGLFRWWYKNDDGVYRYHLLYAPVDNPY